MYLAVFIFIFICMYNFAVLYYFLSINKVFIELSASNEDVTEEGTQTHDRCIQTQKAGRQGFTVPAADLDFLRLESPAKSKSQSAKLAYKSLCIPDILNSPILERVRVI